MNRITYDQVEQRELIVLDNDRGVLLTFGLEKGDREASIWEQRKINGSSIAQSKDIPVRELVKHLQGHYNLMNADGVAPYTTPFGYRFDLSREDICSILDFIQAFK